MAGNKLDTLAQELYEDVIQNLGLEDICSLRLVNFTMANKTDSRVFKKFLRQKHITDSRSDLEEFIRMTSAGRRSGCLVQELTYVTTVYYMRNLEMSMVEGQIVNLSEEELDRDEMLKTGEDARLITQGLRNIPAAIGRGLDKLSLLVGISVAPLIASEISVARIRSDSCTPPCAASGPSCRLCVIVASESRI